MLFRAVILLFCIFAVNFFVFLLHFSWFVEFMQEKRPELKDERNSRFGLSVFIEIHKFDGFYVNMHVTGAEKPFWTSHEFS